MKQYLLLNRVFHLIPFIIVLMLAGIWYLLHKATSSNTCLRVAIGFDQVGNAMVGGSEDETVSSRLGRKIEQDDCKPCRVLCKILSFVFRDKFHCTNSIGI